MICRTVRLSPIASIDDTTNTSNDTFKTTLRIACYTYEAICFRLYGVEQPFFDKTWQLPLVEPVAFNTI
jgi:hypothetical protein